MIRLGEMLIKSNIITEDQLNEALKAQVMFGGRLGTNLIELKFVDEKTLADALSKKLGVPAATSDDLASIPESTIEVLSKNVVEKYKVVPISVDKTKLTIATADPSNLNDFDELRFITSKAIKTVIAPEVDLMLAMERYYDIPRDVRYIHMAEKSKGKGEDPESLIPEMSDFIEFKDDVIPEIDKDDVILEVGEDDIVDEVEDKSPKSKSQFALEEAIKEFSIDELYTKLADSKNRDEMSECITDYLGPQFKKTLFVIMKNETAIGWTGTSDHEHIPNISQLVVTLKDPSVFSIVVEEKQHYLGPLLNTPGNLKISEALGSKKPSSQVLVVPIIMKEKVVCALYLEEGQLALKDEVARIQMLAQKISIAFEMLVLRNKIMMA